MTIKEMETYIKKNNLLKLVQELVNGGFSADAAIEYVYDSNTMTNAEFITKYFQRG